MIFHLAFFPAFPSNIRCLRMYAWERAQLYKRKIVSENICKLRFLITVFWVTMVAVSLKILLYEKKRVWMNECLTKQKMPKIDTLDALEEHKEHEDDYQTNSNW